MEQEFPDRGWRFDGSVGRGFLVSNIVIPAPPPEIATAAQSGEKNVDSYRSCQHPDTLPLQAGAVHVEPSDCARCGV